MKSVERKEGIQLVTSVYICAYHGGPYEENLRGARAAQKANRKKVKPQINRRVQSVCVRIKRESRSIRESFSREIDAKH